MKTKTILGVRFLSGSALQAVEAGLGGGLVVVPSAPVLMDMASKPALREAVLGADLAIADSGLMVLLWWLLTHEKLERVSGLEYLKLLLEKLQKLGVKGSGLGGETRRTHNGELLTENASGVFWIMPTEAAQDKNLAWLQAQGFPTTEVDCYVAPKYPAEGPLSDGALLAVIRERRPAHIIIALGGGVQERLGFSLREALSAKSEGQSKKPHALGPSPSAVASLPGIHCIGAAIGFLSGEQVRIPMWVDYLYLGWLWRSVSAPGKFVPRYWKAARLVGLMWRYRDKAPKSEG